MSHFTEMVQQAANSHENMAHDGGLVYGYMLSYKLHHNNLSKIVEDHTQGVCPVNARELKEVIDNIKSDLDSLYAKVETVYEQAACASLFAE